MLIGGCSDKVDALRGGLKGGYIDVLIIDRITAQKLAQ
ncbi:MULTISPECIES: sugar-binding domain-containing protein [Gammaproteobacteria]